MAKLLLALVVFLSSNNVFADPVELNCDDIKYERNGRQIALDRLSQEVSNFASSSNFCSFKFASNIDLRCDGNVKLIRLSYTCFDVINRYQTNDFDLESFVASQFIGMNFTLRSVTSGYNRWNEYFFSK